MSQGPGTYLRIVSIADAAEHVDTLARWHIDQWGHLELGDSFEARIADLREQVRNPNVLAHTFVALDGDTLLGSASLMEQTDEVFRASPRQQNLSPWLASVYVRPEARGRGVASALVRHSMAHAASHGVRRLYLFTDGARGLYEMIGWQVIGTDRHDGLEMTIMAIDLVQGT
jgi:GNAT superfamily N-acetyltransferase